ncbi:hypothetical protein [Ferrimonas kyonanensis]|uniref:hypothetical protein n=1 Tax=Ferrimonas kyonanensis TaxID=364763 RepID=UPI00047FF894|nr:hypothetical protein [Ferrimonas kyonanensis]
MELAEEIYESIQSFCNDGDVALEDDDLHKAYQSYMKAWELIPEPKTDWEASTWVLGALADVYFFNENFSALKESLEYAMHCPNAIGNPFLHMRLGQAQLELGNTEKAKDELARALTGAGKDIFENDDPKYFNFIIQFMQPPEGQDSW